MRRADKSSGPLPRPTPGDRSTPRREGRRPPPPRRGRTPAGSRQLPRGALDRLADAHVRPAAAEIASHRFLDVLVGGLAVPLEQRDHAHDLSALAVAALHHVLIDPRILYDAPDGIPGDALDRHGVSIADERDRDEARPRGDPVAMHRTRAARADAAAAFRAGEPELLAQDPQQRSRGIDVDRRLLAVDEKRYGHGVPAATQRRVASTNSPCV